MATKRKKPMTSGPAVVYADDVFEGDRSCPKGVPQSVWDAHLAKEDARTAESVAEVTKHVRAYDRAVAAKEAKATRTKAAAERSKPKTR